MLMPVLEWLILLLQSGTVAYHVVMLVAGIPFLILGYAGSVTFATYTVVAFRV
jgi:hypothetical protein